nr:uncharacterized protein LOC117680512 isoform X2 [Crassostrea gigas]
MYVPEPAGSDVSVSFNDLENSRYDSSWREGRRVVELGVLADGLSGCEKCGIPLHFSHSIGVLTCGLCSFLKVQCKNTICQYLNTIPTGKRHGKIWDANTKLATGMMHSGIGPSQVNALLSSLNIPTVSTRTLQNRQNELGTVMEKVAEDTKRSSLHEEIQATLESEGTDELTVSVDAGWQKRGSGRSFDSLSGSTQANESFNKTVSMKAPKNHHFSSSASLNYRVAASVAEKNTGQTYVVEVNRRVGLSPGKHTKKFCYLRDSQSRKRQAIARTKKAKRRRIELKAKKCQTTSCKEIREGPTYMSGVGIGDPNSAVKEIPRPSSVPQLQSLSSIKDHSLVFFDLETTGLARTSHILQVAAVCGDESFSTYVMPKEQITPSASEVTGLKLNNGALYHNERKVNAISISSALESFLSFIEKQACVILVGHNIKSFDVHVLFHALDSCSLLDRMAHCVQGFLDTKYLFKLVHPSLCSYRQQHLSDVLLQCTYNAHDAVEDVLMLKRLFDTVQFCDDEHSCTTCTFQYALSAYCYQKVVKRNIPSLQCLVDKNVLSAGMAKKVAGSGLDFECLRLAHSRSADGIHALFTEQCGNSSVRVTKCKKKLLILSQTFSCL